MPTSRLFVEDTITGKIRVTRQGVELFGKKFSEVGINIRKITTRDDIRHALDLMLAKQVREFAAGPAGRDPLLREIFHNMPGWDTPDY